MREIDAVLRGFVFTDENNRDIPAMFLGQFAIQIDIHLAQWRAEFEAPSSARMGCDPDALARR